MARLRWKLSHLMPHVIWYCKMKESRGRRSSRSASVMVSCRKPSPSSSSSSSSSASSFSSCSSSSSSTAASNLKSRFLLLQNKKHHHAQSRSTKMASTTRSQRKKEAMVRLYDPPASASSPLSSSFIDIDDIANIVDLRLSNHELRSKLKSLTSHGHGHRCAKNTTPSSPSSPPTFDCLQDADAMVPSPSSELSNSFRLQQTPPSLPRSAHRPPNLDLHPHQHHPDNESAPSADDARRRRTFPSAAPSPLVYNSNSHKQNCASCRVLPAGHDSYACRSFARQQKMPVSSSLHTFSDRVPSSVWGRERTFSNPLAEMEMEIAEAQGCIQGGGISVCASKPNCKTPPNCRTSTIKTARSKSSSSGSASKSERYGWREEAETNVRTHRKSLRAHLMEEHATQARPAASSAAFGADRYSKASHTQEVSAGISIAGSPAASYGRGLPELHRSGSVSLIDAFGHGAWSVTDPSAALNDSEKDSNYKRFKLLQRSRTFRAAKKLDFSSALSHGHQHCEDGDFFKTCSTPPPAAYNRDVYPDTACAVTTTVGSSVCTSTTTAAACCGTHIWNCSNGNKDYICCLQSIHSPSDARILMPGGTVAAVDDDDGANKIDGDAVRIMETSAAHANRLHLAPVVSDAATVHYALRNTTVQTMDQNNNMQQQMYDGAAAEGERGIHEEDDDRNVVVENEETEASSSCYGDVSGNIMICRSRRSRDTAENQEGGGVLSKGKGDKCGDAVKDEGEEPGEASMAKMESSKGSSNDGCRNAKKKKMMMTMVMSKSSSSEMEGIGRAKSEISHSNKKQAMKKKVEAVEKKQEEEEGTCISSTSSGRRRRRRREVPCTSTTTDISTSSGDIYSDPINSNPRLRQPHLPRKVLHDTLHYNGTTLRDSYKESLDDESGSYYAMVKCSQDPHEDFKQSMMEMIQLRRSTNKSTHPTTKTSTGTSTSTMCASSHVNSSTSSSRGDVSGFNGGVDAEELVELLRCYLSLNAHHYHPTILHVFLDVCTHLNIFSSTTTSISNSQSSRRSPI